MFHGFVPLAALFVLCFQLPGLTRTPVSLQAPTSSPTAAGDSLEARLLAFESACNVDHVVRINHQFATNGKFCWSLYFSRDALVKQFDSNRYQTSLPPNDRLLTWYRDVTEQLVSTLKTCAAGIPDSTIPADWDIILSFSEGDPGGYVFRYAAEFSGTRLVESDFPYADPDPVPADADGPRFEVKVVPDSRGYPTTRTLIECL